MVLDALTEAEITRALAAEGCGHIVVGSRVLDGQEIFLVRDETVPVPEPSSRLVRFTLAEPRQIGQERWSAEQLRAVVAVKDVLRRHDREDVPAWGLVGDETKQARLVPAPGPGKRP